MKDESGTIACVMFAGSRAGLSFRLQEGQQLIVLGSVSVYERDGRYQLYAREIVRDGVGALYERFEALKKELSEMGMFAPEYKRPIPRYVRTVGIVTAPTGAAVRDIINIAAGAILMCSLSCIRLRSRATARLRVWQKESVLWRKNRLM